MQNFQKLKPGDGVLFQTFEGPGFIKPKFHLPNFGPGTVEINSRHLDILFTAVEYNLV